MISKLYFSKGTKIFSTEESQIIFDKILLFSSDDETNFKKQIFVGYSKNKNHVEFETFVSTDLRPFLVLFITRITNPSNDRSLDAEFLNKIFHLDLKNLDLYSDIYWYLDRFSGEYFRDIQRLKPRGLLNNTKNN